MYLEAEDAIAIMRSFGVHELQNLGKLEGALASPRVTVQGQDIFPDAASKIGALMYALAQAHAYVDGNKRAAAVLGPYFAYRNSFDIVMTEGELAAVILLLARGELTRSDLIEWLRPRIR